MAQTLPDITIGSDWVDVNTTSGIAAGTSMLLINKGTGTLLLQENSSQPSTDSTDGVLVTTNNHPYAVANIKSGSLTVWAKVIGNLGTTITVQEVV